ARRTIPRVISTALAAVLGFVAGAVIVWLILRQAAARKLAEAAARHAAQIASLETQVRAAAERQDLLARAEGALREAFRSMASEALQANSETLAALSRAALERTQEQAKGDLERRQQAIAELVAPIAQALSKVDERLSEVEKDRIATTATLVEQLKQLGAGLSSLQGETGRLVRALRQPHVRGHWGEVQLRQVVELAGMVEHTDFVEQATVNTEDGRIRPDLIVRLPGGKRVIVDAKAPLAAYFDAVDAQDDAQRAALMAEHARQVREHLTRLGSKA